MTKPSIDQAQIDLAKATRALREYTGPADMKAAVLYATAVGAHDTYLRYARTDLNSEERAIAHVLWTRELDRDYGHLLNAEKVGA